MVAGWSEGDEIEEVVVAAKGPSVLGERLKAEGEELPPGPDDKGAPRARSMFGNAPSVASVSEIEPDLPHVIPDEEDRLPTPAAELLQCHYYLSFKKLQEMAKTGEITSTFTNPR